MTKFKVGDKVKKVRGESDERAMVGDVGVVKSQGSSLLVVLKGSSCTCWEDWGLVSKNKNTTKFLLQYEIESDPFEEFATTKAAVAPNMTKEERFNKWKKEHPLEFERLMKLSPAHEKREARKAELVRKLEGRAELVIYLYVQGYTLQEVGTVFGISRERVRQILLKENLLRKAGRPTA